MAALPHCPPPGRDACRPFCVAGHSQTGEHGRSVPPCAIGVEKARRASRGGGMVCQAAGRVRVIWVPWPGWLAAVSWPPWARASPAATASPMPLPEVRAAPRPRQNRSKTCGSSSAGMTVRRFSCRAPGCERKIFSEQVEGLTARYARKTPLLAGALASIAVVLAGRARSRLAAALGVPTSRQVMVRLVMAVPDPEAAAPRVLGVDDFAIRRGQHYSRCSSTSRPARRSTSSRAVTPSGSPRNLPGAALCRSAGPRPRRHPELRAGLDSH